MINYTIKKKVIKISNSSGFFSKFKKRFTSGEAIPITKEDVSSDNILNDISISKDAISEDFDKPIVGDDIKTPNDTANSPNNTYDLNSKYESIQSLKSSPCMSIKDSSSDCLISLDTHGNNYYTTGKRKLLFKVEKYKFNYPVPKSTTLYYYPNLPIIQSLEVTTNPKKSSDTTTITCGGKSVVIPIQYEYEEITFKPYVSFSVALYNQKPPGLFNNNKPPTDIENLDIYALENDALFLIPFTMCFSDVSKTFVPSDFSVNVTVTDPLGGTVSPVCEFDTYYLYELEVEIELQLSPLIDLSFINLDTLRVLNLILGKPEDNTLYTQGELDYVINIDYTGVANLDYAIFDYLLNLRILNISSTGANIDSDSKFAHLNNLIRLTTLIAKNNNFLDYSAFSLLINLVPTLTTISIDNDFTKFISLSSTSEDTSVLAISKGLLYLDMFKNLTSLSAVNNGLTYLDNGFASLSKLQHLNLSHNIIKIFPDPIFSMLHLTNLDLSFNQLTTLPPDIHQLLNLTDFDLSFNQLTSIPTEIGNLLNLSSLNLSNNNLTNIPDEIGNLLSLAYLDLSENNLTTLPAEFSNLLSLVSLNLNGNSIQDLSPLFDLPNLEFLSIEGNPIDPGSIENLPVTILDLSNSSLDNQYIIDIRISQKLETLIISKNNISDISPLAVYNINIFALDQTYYYTPPLTPVEGIFTIDLQTFLKDLDGEPPCIDYISNGGVCGPIESCDCLSITWVGIIEPTEVYFDFSNAIETFSGRVFIQLNPS